MKYRNASELLPAQYLQELQRHAAGQMLYVPAQRRKPWGEGTGARTLYARRNAEIRSKYSLGTDVGQLSESHCISEDAVRKILYTKGEAAMIENEFEHCKYYWQNDLVRIRRSRPDDWKFHDEHIDSENRFFTDGTQELPSDKDLWRENWENYIHSNRDSDTWICLAVETLDGEYVGGGNIHGIDERNGTFGIFIGAKEERYAVAAARLMLDYCFNERRLHKCSDYFYEGDTIFMPIFEKLGFKREGVKRQEVFHKGRYWDEIHYGLLAEEFNAQQM